MDVPEVEVPDPAVPVPVPMPPEIAELRANTPRTDFTPPPQPRPAANQTSAPPPAAQQAEQAAAPQTAVGPQASDRAIDQWQSSVLRHLAQRRSYPSGAQQRGEQGVAVVRFVIDMAGRVQSVQLARSSGFSELDQAAVELITRSSPVPAPPAGLPPARLTLNVPVDYTRR